jgi:hypothetical protein
VNTKNMLDRFSIYPVTPIHQINAPSSFVTISQSSIAKEAWGYAKIIQKRERERKRKSIERMDKCPKEK